MDIDVMDSRDLQERINELEGQEERDTDEQEELDALLALKEETESSGWDDGILFINTDDFEEYAQELAEEIGAIPKDSQWPAYCIDWEWAARELSSDYSSVTFREKDYYYREA
jgi:antirestriction protein